MLKEVSEVIPAFAVAEGGKVPEFGVPLGESSPAGAAAVPFSDAWTQPRGHKAGGRNA